MSAWPSVRLGDIARIRRGASPRPKGDPKYFGGNVPWLKIGDVPVGSRFVSTTGETVTEAGRAKSVYVEPGTLLLSNSASVGRPVITKVGVCIHDGWLAIDEFDRALRQDFLYWVLIQSQSRLESIASSGTQKNLNKDLISNFEVPIPALDEQERIVKLLDEADALRKLRAEADRRMGELVPALFYEMFGDPGENPMGWQKATLGDIANLYSGATPSRSEAGNWDGTIPWISPKDMKSEELYRAEESITEEAATTARLRLLPSHTVLVVVRGMILAHTIPICLTKMPSTINQDVKALIPTREINAVYLQWALKAQHRGLLRQVATAGHGTKKLDSDRLRALPVPLPPIESQRVFASFVEKVHTLRQDQDLSGKVLGKLTRALQSSCFQ